MRTSWRHQRVSRGWWGDHGDNDADYDDHISENDSGGGVSYLYIMKYKIVVVDYDYPIFVRIVVLLVGWAMEWICYLRRQYWIDNGYQDNGDDDVDDKQ